MPVAKNEGASRAAIEANEPPEPPATPSFTISDAILVAAFTALAYYYSYRFESGFLKAHHISPDLVEVSLTTVLLTVGATLSPLVFVFFVLTLFRSLITPTVLLVFRVGRWFIAFALGTVLFFANTGWSASTITFLVVTAINAWLAFVTPIFGAGSYLEKLAKADERDRQSQLNMLGPYIRFLGYRLWNLLLLLVLVLPGVIGWWGEQRGKSQQTFAIFNYQGRAWGIVRAYGDRWIVREINYSTGSFESHYAVMDAEPVVLTESKVSQ